ncbi:hypothetical protein Ddye_024387 [Dipteronia dyeriana]|uniref:Uncharacterized protein n=1 Tax=Dipteronia dyeriana TaxID=168575 RepID=A0AAD9TUS0_9ROSI|nr:hypothetical protein Ddye_024387 [Dipteronia dyeriana]
MDEYLEQMKSWVDVLAIIGNQYPGVQLIANVLSSLDNEYMPIIVLIESKESISWQELQDTLLSYDSKLNHINKNNKLSGALSANFVLNNRGNSSQNIASSQGQNNHHGGNIASFSNRSCGGRFRGR